LQVVFVVSFVFNQIKVFLIELVIFVLYFLFLNIIKFLDPLERLVDYGDRSISKEVNLGLSQEAFLHLEKNLANRTGL